MTPKAAISDGSAAQEVKKRGVGFNKVSDSTLTRKDALGVAFYLRYDQDPCTDRILGPTARV